MRFLSSSRVGSTLFLAALLSLLFTRMTGVAQAQTDQNLLPLERQLGQLTMFCRILPRQKVRIEFRKVGAKSYGIFRRYIDQKYRELTKSGKKRQARLFRSNALKEDATLLTNCRGMIAAINRPTATPTSVPTPPATSTPTPRLVPFVYYSSGLSVNRINLETMTEELNILQRTDVGTRSVQSLQFHAPTNSLYWSDNVRKAIYKRDLTSGVERQIFVSENPNLVFCIADGTETIYFTDGPQALKQMGLDGEQPSVRAVIATSFIKSLSLSASGDEIFITKADSILRYNLTTETLETLLPSSSAALTSAIEDPVTGDLIVSSFLSPNLQRLDIRTLELSPLVAGLMPSPRDTVRYLPARDEFITAGRAGLSRISREGIIVYTDPATSLGHSFPHLLAVDPGSDRVFVRSFLSNRIKEYNLETRTARRIVEPRSFISDIVFDSTTRQMFFRDQARDEIVVANPDGSEQLTIADGLSNSTSAGGLAISENYQRVVWDAGGGFMRSTRYDGSNSTSSIITPPSLSAFYEVFFTLDNTQGFYSAMSVRESFNSVPFTRIVRIAGGAIEQPGSLPDLVFGISAPSTIFEGNFTPAEILRDPNTSQVYFLTTPFSQGLERSAIYRIDPGAQSPVLIESDLGWPKAIALSADGSTLYWTDDLSDSIYRKDLVSGAVQSIGGVNGAEMRGIALTYVPL